MIQNGVEAARWWQHRLGGVGCGQRGLMLALAAMLLGSPAAALLSAESVRAQDDPLALAMLIDVFSERGYHAAVDIHRIDVPEKCDLTTGEIQCRVKKVYRIQIRFEGSEIRRG